MSWPQGKGKNSACFSTCTLLGRDRAGLAPADGRQGLTLHIHTGLSKPTHANGLIKLKPVYVTHLHKEKLVSRLD